MGQRWGHRARTKSANFFLYFYQDVSWKREYVHIWKLRSCDPTQSGFPEGGGGGGTLHLSLSYLFPESHSISLTVPLTFNWLIHCLIGGPVEVAVGFWVLSIDTINVVHMVSLKQGRVKRPFEAGTL